MLRHQRVVTEWIKKSKSVTNDDFSRSVYRHLSRVANAIIIKHGRLIGDKSLLVSLVSGFVCNGYGSDVIGKQIQPLIEHAAKVEGLQVLPPQLEPVIINIKGASAAGKSTMRPLQRQQTEKLGIHWHDFSLISPDIWRKYLLDYDSLGEASKYAGTLAGDELPVIDQKLDRYIRRKARRGHISHMLIDRFRFDSFAPGSGMREGSNLLTRFGHTIYLTFMVTPPEATVERAWERGLKVGRYKPVDDLLDHNIEAFKGMPVLFFTWALNKNKTVHFEFLDNSVDYGKKPRTIAFGNNDEMYLYDFKCMFDIVRYTKLNIEACCPEELYPDVDLAAGANTDFLLKCAEKLSRLNFVDRQTGLVYAAMESGKMSWVDHKLIGQMLKDDEIKAGFQAIAEDVVHHLEELTQADARAISPETFQHVMGEIN